MTMTTTAAATIASSGTPAIFIANTLSLDVVEVVVVVVVVEVKLEHEVGHEGSQPTHRDPGSSVHVELPRTVDSV